VDGVLSDEFVVNRLYNLDEEENKYFEKSDNEKNVRPFLLIAEKNCPIEGC